MATLAEIERLCGEYSVARQTLKESAEELNKEIERLKRKKLPQILKNVEFVSEIQMRLKAAIEESPKIFQKPRTQIFNGIEVGIRKGKGNVVIEDEKQTLRLIHKYYPDEWENYIKVIEKPIKTTLSQLSVVELKKLGITVVETGDEVVIKAKDSEIDRLVNLLLKDVEIKEVEEAV